MHPSDKERRNDEAIVIRGARTHNLKNISLDLPHGKIIVLTGPSGSGKSSLAFDTIYAEGQRRYVESLSSYARQFLEQVQKPDVEWISGLSPTISIDQKQGSYNPRSTVGTITEISDFLRLLYSKMGLPRCYQCSRPVQAQSPQQIVDQILSLTQGQKIAILAPIIRGRKGEHQKELFELGQKGFVRIRVNGKVFDLSETISIEKNKKNNIDVYVDRLIVRKDDESFSTRVTESVDLALRLGEGNLILEKFSNSPGASEETLFSEKQACSFCQISYPDPEPRSFSFNSPVGACPTCEGLGYHETEETSDDEDTEELIEERVRIRDFIPCEDCHGSRLRKESLSYEIESLNIFQLGEKDIQELTHFFETWKLSDRAIKLVGRVVKEIIDRLKFLNQVGAGYLTLNRPARTLSGGETQRIRLATQIGSSLVGVTYVLDEPSIGLHPRDTDRLLNTLTELRDHGNTVIVVEHDRETIEKADWIVDLGPGAGELGGIIVGQGTLKEIRQSKKSITGKYLRGESLVHRPEYLEPRPTTGEQTRYLEIVGARNNNLKNVSVKIPLGTFVCVTGVSGSGKSTLILDTLYPLVRTKINGTTLPKKILVDSVRGIEHLDKIIDIDQSPIGRTPRSNPATYTGLFKFIRDLFSQLPESQMRGYKPGRFSFNVAGGRCEPCEGDGLKRIQMHFMPDVFVECETCRGSRYNADTLSVLYRGKSIADVLNMTVREALQFFDSVYFLKSRLQVLTDVGLGYIRLGQSATTFSGGEAQRIKLSKELSKIGTGKTLYILDEPSTGLHFDDVQKLVEILHRLVTKGNTVIVIEHNLDIIKTADFVIDLGPDGGGAGGQLLFAGSPLEMTKHPTSQTGAFLKNYF